MIDEGNNTGIAEFSGGSNIEIRVENGIISVMLVTLPNQYRSLTRGLMGNYNGEKSDDFIPKGASSSISIDSDKEDIFTLGNTCTVKLPLNRDRSLSLVRRFTSKPQFTGNDFALKVILYLIDIRYHRWTLTNPNSLGPEPVQISGLVNA